MLCFSLASPPRSLRFGGRAASGVLFRGAGGSAPLHALGAGKRAGARMAAGAPAGEDAPSAEEVARARAAHADRYRGTPGEFGRFARSVAVALLIFAVLFFVDVLAALAAFSLASVYAVAVLFGVRGARAWAPRARAAAARAVPAAARRAGAAYRAVRQEVRRRLDD